MNVLLSIKPKYVDEIIAGKKIFEFRKAIFKKKDIGNVFIYSSSPVKKVVASFEIAKIIEDSPQKLWNKCQKYGGIPKEDFFDYYKNSDIGYAIEIKNLEIFSDPIDPYLLKKNFRAPQSYCYLSLDYFKSGTIDIIPRKKSQDTRLPELVTPYIKHVNINKESCEKVGWEIVRLGDFAIYKKGKKPKKQQTEANDLFKYPYVDIKAFDKGEVDFYTDGDKCVICEDGDFVMVWDGSRSGYVGKAIKGALGSTLMRIKFPGIENSFAYSFLQSKYLEINTRAKGTGTPHVDPGILWNYQFPVPPLPEQRAIVSKIEQLFSELDNGIANLKVVQEQLKVYRQAVLKKAFEGELTREWREQQTNLPDAEDLQEQIRVEREESYSKKLDEWKLAVKEWEGAGKEGKKPTKPKKAKETKPLTEMEIAKLTKLPERWKWAIVDEILQPNRECAYGVLQPGTDIPEGIPLVRVGDIANGKVNTSGLKKISPDIANKYKRTFLEGGELLISLVGAIGRTAIVPIQIKDANVARAVGVVPISKILNPFYIEYFFRRAEKIHELTSQAHEVARKTLNLEDVRKATVAICSLEEQQAIVTEIETRLSVCDKVEQDIEDNLEKAEALRQSILKKAFEGKLLNERELEGVRSAPDWEPAEVLLKRIKAEKKIRGESA